MKKFLCVFLLIFAISYVAYTPPSAPDISGETFTGKIIAFSTKARPGTLILDCEDKYHHFLIDESTQLIWESSDKKQTNTPAVISDGFWGSGYVSVTAGCRTDYHEGHWWNKADWYHADKITILEKSETSS